MIVRWGMLIVSIVCVNCVGAAQFTGSYSLTRSRSQRHTGSHWVTLCSVTISRQHQRLSVTSARSGQTNNNHCRVFNCFQWQVYSIWRQVHQIKNITNLTLGQHQIVLLTIVNNKSVNDLWLSFMKFCVVISMFGCVDISLTSRILSSSMLRPVLPMRVWYRIKLKN